MGMLQLSAQFQEGEALNKWIDSRFKRNKNILIAIPGATGSGKSWTGVRICELWYRYKFDVEFPVETHVCFSIGKVMKLLSSGNLKRGELVILEEAGVNLNALNFQSEVSKLFTFILQSFRSMNVGLLFTLPVLTMLNKSARLLLHVQLLTSGIDFEKEICKVKPLFHQLNQETGKSYWKFMRVKRDGNILTLERFNYHKPSDNLINIYEHQKRNFVFNLSKDFSDRLDDIDKEHQKKMAREELTPVEQEVFDDCINSDLTPKESSEKRGRGLRATYDALRRIKKKGFEWEKYKNLKKS